MVYLNPNVTISKLEKNNKYFQLLNANDSSYIPNLALKEYEIFNVGADINLIMFSLPFLKSKFYLDPGISFGRSGVVDSVFSTNDGIVNLNEQGVNTLSFKATGRVAVQLDETYFFELHGILQNINILHDNIYQIATKNNYNTDLNFFDKSLYTVELFAGYSPPSSSSGKLFFRYRYSGSIKNSTQSGYSQVQVGYSYYFNKQKYR